MRTAFRCAALLLLLANQAHAAEQDRVFLIHAVGHAYSPWSDMAGRFRAALVKRARGTGIQPKDHGLGLGLTICSTIIQAHDGKLTVSNHEDGGAVAMLSLPAREFLVAAQ